MWRKAAPVDSAGRPRSAWPFPPDLERQSSSPCSAEPRVAGRLFGVPREGLARVREVRSTRPGGSQVRRGRTSIVGGLLRVNESQEAHWTGERTEVQTRTLVVKFHASRARWRRTRHLAAVGVVGDVDVPTFELLSVLHHPLGPLARSRRGLLEVSVPLEVVADDFVALENGKAKEGQPMGRAGLEGSEVDAPCETGTFRSSIAGLYGRQRTAWVLMSFAERRQEGGRLEGTMPSAASSKVRRRVARNHDLRLHRNSSILLSNGLST